MALNPILNVFQIQLNPTKEEYKTFTDFYNQKFSIQNDEKLLFQSLCAKIIQELGDKEFKKDTISKKVVGVKKTKKLNNTLKLHSDKYILEGIIEGGKYDNLREYADINNKDSRSLLDRNKAVLDLYYLLCI